MEADRRARLLSIGQRLIVDVWAAEAVAGLRLQGVPVVLLKGPTVARWLYRDDPLGRTYTDVDLLVPVAEVERAALVLRGLGYRDGADRRYALAADHATTLRRDRDGAVVDLHWKLHGMEDLAADARVWEVMAGDPEELVVAGVAVAIPNVVARTMHVALHLEPDDPPGTQPWEDLRRAVDAVDRSIWAAAADMGRSLHLDGEMGARLRLVPAGAALADELVLARPPSAWFAIRAATAQGRVPAGARGMNVLLAPGSMREKGRRVVRGLFPPDATVGDVVRILSTLPRCLALWRRLRRAG